MNKHPLVSIVIITYNSSKYIQEALEGVKNQIYENIELIITDDCSNDNTVMLCQEWLAINNKRFIDSKIITVSVNTGVSANCNRGVKAAKGDWIKYIAGDDVLLPNCIFDNLNFISDNNISFLYSKPVYINDKSEIIKYTLGLKKYDEEDKFYNLTSRQQFLSLLYKNYPMSAPTSFFKSCDMEKLGGFSEGFINEDFPLYLKATKAGYKMYFMNKETVLYRKHSSSMSSKFGGGEAVSFWEKIKLEQSIRAHIDLNLFLSRPLIFLDFYNRLLYSKLLILFGNKRHNIKWLIFLRFLSPLFLIEKIKSKFNRQILKSI